MAIAEIQIDGSEFVQLMDILSQAMEPEAFERAMYGIFRKTEKKVKNILGKDVPQEYNVPQAQVRSAVAPGQVSDMSCIVPVKAPRKHIGGGGQGFPAWGSRPGWEAARKPPYKVTTMIYKGKRVSLPGHMGSYGGQPPFRNSSAPKLHGLTFTRLGKERLPIEPVVGIAIPQMPTNKARPQVQDDIRVYLEEQLAKRIQAALRGY